MKVSHLESPSGNEIVNQFKIIDDHGNVFFQSYGSIIVKIDSKGDITLDELTWDYSTTTGKYRNQFLGEKRPATERKIKSGEYKLADLN